MKSREFPLESIFHQILISTFSGNASFTGNHSSNLSSTTTNPFYYIESKSQKNIKFSPSKGAYETFPEKSSQFEFGEKIENIKKSTESFQNFVSIFRCCGKVRNKGKIGKVEGTFRIFVIWLRKI